MLAEDVRRQAQDTLTVSLPRMSRYRGWGTVRAPLFLRTTSDLEIVVCITHPLTPHVPSASELEEMKEYSSMPVVTASELTVRRSLPSATQDVLTACGIR